MFPLYTYGVPHTGLEWPFLFICLVFVNPLSSWCMSSDAKTCKFPEVTHLLIVFHSASLLFTTVLFLCGHFSPSKTPEFFSSCFQGSVQSWSKSRHWALTSSMRIPWQDAPSEAFGKVSRLESASPARTVETLYGVHWVHDSHDTCLHKVWIWNLRQKWDSTTSCNN